MKGSLKTVRISGHSTKTNFNDWSDPKYKLPATRVKKSLSEESFQLTQPNPDLSEVSKTTVSQTSIELNDTRDKIRKGHPLMSKKEIRNFRLPFYESLLLNLKDDGFLLTYEFIKDLIAVDDVFHKDLKTDFSLKKRPILKFTKSVLDPLSNGLMTAETSKLNEEKNQEATAFLDLAILFSKADNPSWYWIAQEMFEQCMEVVDNDDKPVDLQLKATSKYLYASFLFRELHKLTEAKTQIEFSMSISESKYWTIGDTKDKKGNTLYYESCLLLHKIFLEMAQDELNQNTDEAIQLCRSGLLWAKVINCKTAEIDALWKLINIYLTVQQLYSVQELLESYMKLCTELDDFDGLCEGYILCARYHDSVGEKANVIDDMKKLLQIAKENNITKMVAMAHHKLATYCLMRGTEKELLEHAIEAYMSYLNLKKNIKEIEEARCLVGVAQGLEIMKEYCNLVFEIDSYNSNELLVLLSWKNLRIPFFDKKFVLIPEMYLNSDLLDKTENRRVLESLAHADRRKSELISLTSKRPSTVIFGSLQKTLSTQSNVSQRTRERTDSPKASTVKPSNSNKSDETHKYRSISFLDHEVARSASEMLENK